MIEQKILKLTNRLGDISNTYIEYILPFSVQSYFGVIQGTVGTFFLKMTCNSTAIGHRVKVHGNMGLGDISCCNM